MKSARKQKAKNRKKNAEKNLRKKKVLKFKEKELAKIDEDHEEMGDIQFQVNYSNLCDIIYDFDTSFQNKPH